MQAKALGTDAALKLRLRWAGKAHPEVFPCQHFLSRSGVKGNAVGAGRRMLGRQSGFVLVIGQEGDPGVFFHERAVAGLGDSLLIRIFVSLPKNR